LEDYKAWCCTHQELDGAIDAVPLGGLVGEDIYLIPEQVQRLLGG